MSSSNRVNEKAVREIVTTELENISGFISTANALTNTITDLDETILREIELYLSAHFVSVADKFQRVKGSKVGDGSDQFHTATGSGFESTIYGEQALLLDSTGTLKNRQMKKKAAMYSL